jgi:hypothetical protein
MASSRIHVPIASLGVALAITACADPTGRPYGQAWQPAGGDSQDDASGTVPDDDDGEWPEPTQGQLPNDDTANATNPGPDPGGGGSDTDDATTGAPQDTGLPPQSPYVGGWDIGTCQDDIVAGGDVVADFQLLDSHGDTVRLYDFCHKAVFLTDGAFW